MAQDAAHPGQHITPSAHTDEQEQVAEDATRTGQSTEQTHR